MKRSAQQTNRRTSRSLRRGVALAVLVVLVALALAAAIRSVGSARGVPPEQPISVGAPPHLPTADTGNFPASGSREIPQSSGQALDTTYPQATKSALPQRQTGDANTPLPSPQAAGSENVTHPMEGVAPGEVRGDVRDLPPAEPSEKVYLPLLPLPPPVPIEPPPESR